MSENILRGDIFTRLDRERSKLHSAICNVMGIDHGRCRDVTDNLDKYGYNAKKVYDAILQQKHSYNENKTNIRRLML